MAIYRKSTCSTTARSFAARDANSSRKRNMHQLVSPLPLPPIDPSISFSLFSMICDFHPLFFLLLIAQFFCMDARCAVLVSTRALCKKIKNPWQVLAYTQCKIVQQTLESPSPHQVKYSLVRQIEKINAEVGLEEVRFKNRRAALNRN
jgi:hypothetical protein